MIAQIGRQRLEVGHRMMTRLVAGDAHEAHPGLRDERVRLIDHAQTGAQHRHQKRRVGQPATERVGQRSAHHDVLPAQVAGGLEHQHVGQVAQRSAERGIVGALIAQRGQPRCGQRMVDDTHVHGTEL